MHFNQLKAGKLFLRKRRLEEVSSILSHLINLLFHLLHGLFTQAISLTGFRSHWGGILIRKVTVASLEIYLNIFASHLGPIWSCPSLTMIIIKECSLNCHMVESEL